MSLMYSKVFVRSCPFLPAVMVPDPCNKCSLLTRPPLPVLAVPAPLTLNRSSISIKTKHYYLSSLPVVFDHYLELKQLEKYADPETVRVINKIPSFPRQDLGFTPNRHCQIERRGGNPAC